MRTHEFTNSAGNQMLITVQLGVEAGQAIGKLFNVSDSQFVCSVVVNNGIVGLKTEPGGGIAVAWKSLEELKSFAEECILEEHG